VASTMFKYVAKNPRFNIKSTTYKSEVELIEGAVITKGSVLNLHSQKVCNPKGTLTSVDDYCTRPGIPKSFSEQEIVKSLKRISKERNTGKIIGMQQACRE